MTGKRFLFLVPLFAGLATATPAQAGAVVFGPGDTPGLESEIVVRRVESFRVAGSVKSNALHRTYRVTADEEGDARLRVELTDIRLGTASAPDDVARLSAETEIYLMQALRSVPLLLTYTGDGELAGIAGWEATHRSVLSALDARVEALRAGNVRLHAATSLAADAVSGIDDQVIRAFVGLVANAGPRSFLKAFYEEVAYLMLVAGKRVAVGQSLERRLLVRNPTDGSLADMSYLLRLRRVDAPKARGHFDLRLAGDGIEVLRTSLIARLAAHNLSDAAIARQVAAMPMHWDTEGTAVADIKSGRMAEVRMRSRIQLGDIELTTSEEVDITTPR